MGIKKLERRAYSHVSKGLEALRREIHDNLPLLVRVDVRTRASKWNGRTTKQPTFRYEVDDDAERDADTIHGAIIEEATAIEEEAGTACMFSAEVVVQPLGEAAQVTRTINFRLDDEAGELDELGVQMASLARVASFQDRLLTRTMGRMDQVMEQNASMSRALGELNRSTAELRKIELEHADRMAARASEDARSEQEFAVITDLGPKFLAYQAAKDARRETSERGGPKVAAWRRLISVARILREREAVREILGEDGSDIMDAIAESKRRADVEAQFSELKDRFAAGKIDMWKLLQVAPELVAFADMMA